MNLVSFHRTNRLPRPPKGEVNPRVLVTLAPATFRQVDELGKEFNLTLAEVARGAVVHGLAAFAEQIRAEMKELL